MWKLTQYSYYNIPQLCAHRDNNSQPIAMLNQKWVDMNGCTPGKVKSETTSVSFNNHNDGGNTARGFKVN